MNIRRLVAVAGMLFLASLVLLPTAARTEMYVEGYLGANFASDIGRDIAVANPFSGFVASYKGGVNPSFQGGMKLGTWFVKEGFLGYNYPDWMKYLGFYVDFSYHALDSNRQQGNPIFWLYPGILRNFNFFGENNVRSEGSAATLAFMFAGRYGFLPDSEVPFGRLQPYIGVGPAILFTTQRQTINVTGFNFATDAKQYTNIALAVEAGLRYMALKNVSLDLSFKYRYSTARYTFDVFQANFGLPYTYTYNPTYNLFSLQVGAAYHF